MTNEFNYLPIFEVYYCCNEITRMIEIKIQHWKNIINKVFYIVILFKLSIYIIFLCQWKHNSIYAATNLDLFLIVNISISIHGIFSILFCGLFLCWNERIFISKFSCSFSIVYYSCIIYYIHYIWKITVDL